MLYRHHLPRQDLITSWIGSPGNILVVQILKTLAHFITQYQTIIIINITWVLNWKVLRCYQAQCDRRQVFSPQKKCNFHLKGQVLALMTNPVRCLFVVLFVSFIEVTGSFHAHFIPFGIKCVINAQLWTIISLPIIISNKCYVSSAKLLV